MFAALEAHVSLELQTQKERGTYNQLPKHPPLPHRIANLREMRGNEPNADDGHDAVDHELRWMNEGDQEVDGGHAGAEDEDVEHDEPAEHGAFVRTVARVVGAQREAPDEAQGRAVAVFP